MNCWITCSTCKQEYFSGGIHHCKAEDIAKLLLPRIEALELEVRVLRAKVGELESTSSPPAPAPGPIATEVGVGDL